MPVVAGAQLSRLWAPRCLAPHPATSTQPVLCVHPRCPHARFPALCSRFAFSASRPPLSAKLCSVSRMVLRLDAGGGSERQDAGGSPRDKCGDGHAPPAPWKASTSHAVFTCIHALRGQSCCPHTRRGLVR